MTIIKMEWTKLLKKKNTKVLIGLYGMILLVMSGLYIFGEKSFGLSIYTESQFLKATLSTMMDFILPFKLRSTLMKLNVVYGNSRILLAMIIKF